MRALAAIAILMLLAGCGHRRAFSDLRPKSVEELSDSSYTIERIIPRDTTVLVLPDSLRTTVLISELKDNKPVYARSETGNMKVKIVRVADTLVVDCAEQTRAIRLALADKIREIRRIRHSQTTTEIPVPYVPWWVKVLAWIGGISIVIMAIGGVLKRF